MQKLRLIDRTVYKIWKFLRKMTKEVDLMVFGESHTNHEQRIYNPREFAEKLEFTTTGLGSFHKQHPK